jgi:RNA polymerase sigma-70 factor (ECF subfamily)
VSGERTSETPRSDDRLVDAALEDDPAAFDELVVRYQERVYNLALRLTGDPEAAEDAAQEAFLRAFRALDSFRRGSAFYTWLFRIVVNACHSAGRKTGRRKQVEGVRLDAAGGEGEPGESRRIEPAAPGGTPHEQIERAEAIRRVQEAVQELPQDHKQVILLRDFEGLSYADIAEVLEISRAAVKSRIHRARADLAERLADLQDGNDAGR